MLYVQDNSGRKKGKTSARGRVEVQGGRIQRNMEKVIIVQYIIGIQTKGYHAMNFMPLIGHFILPLQFDSFVPPLNCHLCRWFSSSS